MSIIEKALDKALGRTEDDETPELAAEEQAALPKDGETAAAAKEDARPEAAPAQAEAVERSATPEPVREAPAPSPEPPPPPPSQASGDELPADGPALALDWDLLASHGYVAAEESPLFRTFQSVARPVLANAFPDSRAGIQRGNLLMISSSRAGEGKTFAALNLALTVALGNPDAKVLLVDADTDKASLSRLLGLGERGGLSELLESKNQRLQDLTQRTGLAGLSILPAGQPKQKGYGLLSSSAIMKFAKDLSKFHPGLLVIFDGPPLLDVPETASLAMQVGQVIVVVEVEMTPQIVVREALAKLEFCNVVGCVLNKAVQQRDEDTESLAFGYGLYQPELTES